MHSVVRTLVCQIMFCPEHARRRRDGTIYCPRHRRALRAFTAKHRLEPAAIEGSSIPAWKPKNGKV